VSPEWGHSGLVLRDPREDSTMIVDDEDPNGGMQPAAVLLEPILGGGISAVE
jgi:hypothetical protein